MSPWDKTPKIIRVSKGFSRLLATRWTKEAIEKLQFSFLLYKSTARHPRGKAKIFSFAFIAIFTACEIDRLSSPLGTFRQEGILAARSKEGGWFRRLQDSLFTYLWWVHLWHVAVFPIVSIVHRLRSIHGLKWQETTLKPQLCKQKLLPFPVKAKC